MFKNSRTLTNASSFGIMKNACDISLLLAFNWSVLQAWPPHNNWLPGHDGIGLKGFSGENFHVCSRNAIHRWVQQLRDTCARSDNPTNSLLNGGLRCPRGFKNLRTCAFQGLALQEHHTKPKRKQRMQIVVGILGSPPFETQFETTQRPMETSSSLPPSLPKDLPRRNGGSAGGEGRERGKGKGRMVASREGGFERASHTTR